jgi:hypothetical protein
MSESNPPSKIMVIRHGEKPDGSGDGVAADGSPSKSSLAPSGWRRARALASLFEPSVAGPPGGLATPNHLFSPDYGRDTARHRTYETLLPMSQALGIPIDPVGTVDHPADVVSAAFQAGGVCLICWEHHNIPALAGRLRVVASTPVPHDWPDNRFDVVWVFDLTDAGKRTYHLTQVPERLLDGDSATAIQGA